MMMTMLKTIMLTMTVIIMMIMMVVVVTMVAMIIMMLTTRTTLIINLKKPLHTNSATHIKVALLGGGTLAVLSSRENKIRAF